MLAMLLAYLDNEDDKEYFEKIYLSYRKQMFLLAKSMLHNNEDAEDIVSDVFHRIASKYWDSVRAIKNENDLRNYLLKATKNTTLNLLQRRKCIQISPLDTVEEDVFYRPEVASDKEFLDTLCTRLDTEQLIAAILALKNPIYRDALYYHFVMDLSIADTAQLLDQSVSTTKKQLMRGKKLLLEAMKPKETV